MAWPHKKNRVDELVEGHYRCLFAFAYRLSGSVAEAEDLTQEAFCQAQAKLAQLRDWSRAKSWLFTILRHIYLHRVRAGKKANLVSMDEVGDVPDRLPEPFPEVDGEKLQEALNELPEDWRIPLILFYFEDFSYRDIAEQMNTPLGTVMSRLARAKAFLRGRLLPLTGPGYVTPPAYAGGSGTPPAYAGGSGTPPAYAGGSLNAGSPNVGGGLAFVHDPKEGK